MAILETIISFILSLIFTLSSIFPFLPVKKVDMDRFELVWSDEFDGDSLDSGKWKGLHFSAGNTLVRKGGYWNMDFAQVKDGNLRISTEYYADGYKGNGKPGWYTAGIYTKGLFEQAHGYFEVRCILPKGNGMWSAFWLGCDGMNNVDGSGKDGAEIDIFESAFYGSPIKNKVSTNIHYDGYGEGLQSTNVCEPILAANNPYEEYNTYALEWNEDEYIFYINGIKTGCSTFGGASEAAEYLLLSVEVGGSNGVAEDSWAGDKLEPGTETTDFIIDYVRVYQYK